MESRGRTIILGLENSASAKALAALLYAVHPGAGYFKLSDPGTISVLDDGRTRFVPSPGGRHRHLILDPAQKERLLAQYVSLVTAEPAPRPVRFRPPNVNAAPAAAGAAAPAKPALPKGGKP